MPTPFYHLRIAEELLEHPGLKENIRHELKRQSGFFLFGNTAPDVQAISGQPREDTHFFKLPVLPFSKPPWESMLAAYPKLKPAGLASERAAFMAGYLCHLQADWYWVKDIFAPVFGPTLTWGSFAERLYLHNVLRAYVDQYELEHLKLSFDGSLSQVQLAPWLPFVADQEMDRWQEILVEQLQPGAKPITVDVLSGRHGKTPDDFYQLLRSEERMEEQIFHRLPRHHLDQYRYKVLEENIFLLQAHFQENPKSSHTRPRSRYMHSGPGHGR